MPIYEYECEYCGAVEEAFQKVADTPLATCRKCNGNLHRLISRSSFHLKGTGWYVTDYAKKSSHSSQPSDSSAPAPSKDDSSSAKPKDASPGTDS